MKTSPSDQIANNPTQFNIAAIAKLEEEASLDRRSRYGTPKRRHRKTHRQPQIPAIAL